MSDPIRTPDGTSTLAELWTYFAEQQFDEGRADAYEKSFPERHDFWLFRRTTNGTGLETSDCGAPGEVMERVLNGLASPNVHCDTLRVVSWWKTAAWLASSTGWQSPASAGKRWRWSAPSCVAAATCN